MNDDRKLITLLLMQLMTLAMQVVIFMRIGEVLGGS